MGQFTQTQLDIANHNFKPILERARGMVDCWPDLGFESSFLSRELEEFNDAICIYYGMCHIDLIEQGYSKSFKQKTPHERVIAALEELVKRSEKVK